MSNLITRLQVAIKKEVAAEKYPLLDKLAQTIASETLERIVKDTSKVKDEGMPYKSQYVLEKVIAQLEKSV